MAQSWREVLIERRSQLRTAWGKDHGGGDDVANGELDAWLTAFVACVADPLPDELPLADDQPESDAVAELLRVRDLLQVSLGDVHADAARQVAVRADELLLAYLRERDRRRGDARAVRDAENDHRDRDRRFAALGQLAGGVAHTFNNMLTVITGYASALDTGVELNPLQQRAIQRITDTADRAAELSRHLARGLRGSPPRIGTLVVVELLHEVRDLLGAVLGRSITLEVFAEKGLPPVRADRARLTEALLHLVANAREAMPSGGTLTMTAFGDDDAPDAPFVVIEVRDTGEGLTPEAAERIWEPGFTTRTRADAAGLGCAQVKTIVEAAGGRVEAHAGDGGGTAIRLWLTVAR